MGVIIQNEPTNQKAPWQATAMNVLAFLGILASILFGMFVPFLASVTQLGLLWWAPTIAIAIGNGLIMRKHKLWMWIALFMYGLLAAVFCRYAVLEFVEVGQIEPKKSAGDGSAGPIVSILLGVVCAVGCLYSAFMTYLLNHQLKRKR